MQTKKGVVVSAKMNKTVVVSVTRTKMDPKYKKAYKVSQKFYAHDENNTAQEGDTVYIKAIRPLSKLKRWTVFTPDESQKS